jgi:GMP synthase-like glutamine amidotransferase
MVDLGSSKRRPAERFIDIVSDWDIRETGDITVKRSIGSRRVLVFQHLPVEDTGILGDLLREAGAALTVVELDKGDPIPALDNFHLLLVMGGPMDVWQEDAHPWLREEKAAIRSWVLELGRPYLGVCLGHQLLAEALGGTVGLMDQPEVGVMAIELTSAAAEDPVFCAVPRRIAGLQWHGAQVLTLPPDSVLLASNSNCAIQAFRVGPCAWGVQFHVEVSDTKVPEWAQIPEYRDALEGLGMGDFVWLKNSVGQNLISLRLASNAMFSRLCELVQSGVFQPDGATQ